MTKEVLLQDMIQEVFGVANADLPSGIDKIEGFAALTPEQLKRHMPKMQGALKEDFKAGAGAYAEYGGDIISMLEQVVEYEANIDLCMEPLYTMIKERGKDVNVDSLRGKVGQHLFDQIYLDTGLVETFYHTAAEAYCNPESILSTEKIQSFAQAPISPEVKLQIDKAVTKISSVRGQEEKLRAEELRAFHEQIEYWTDIEEKTTDGVSKTVQKALGELSKDILHYDPTALEKLREEYSKSKLQRQNEAADKAAGDLIENARTLPDQDAATRPNSPTTSPGRDSPLIKLPEPVKNKVKDIAAAYKSHVERIQKGEAVEKGNFYTPDPAKGQGK